MSILDLILVLVLLSWVGGFALNVGGGLIHILLLVAAVIFIFRLLGVRT